MEKAKTIIKVPYGTGRKLAKALRCTNVMVSMSLNFKKDTSLAKKIRYVAIKQYGGEKFIPKKEKELKINKQCTYKF